MMMKIARRSSSVFTDLYRREEKVMKSLKEEVI